MTENHSDESVLDVNVEDGGAFEIIPDGAEAELRIETAEQVPLKKDPSRRQFKLKLVVQSDPDGYDDIYHYIGIPTQAFKAENPKGHKRSVQNIIDFCACFDIEMPCPASQMVGQTGWCIMEESDDGRGGTRNNIKRFVAPRG